MTAGQLRRLLDAVPDDTPILRRWNIGGYTELNFGLVSAHFNEEERLWHQVYGDPAWAMNRYGPLRTVLVAHRTKDFHAPMENVMATTNKSVITSERIKAVIREVNECTDDELADEATLDELGMDSLDVTDMLYSLEDEFMISVPDNTFTGRTTVGQVVEYCLKKV